MAVIVETGTGSATANSYVSEADLAAYASARGITLTATTEALQTQILLRAMDYLEQQNFKGSKYSEAQALQWPRLSVFIDGFSIDYNEIPQLLIDALCEIAIGVDAGNSPLADVSRETKKEKVGAIEVEYMDGARSQTYLKAAAYKLTKLIMAGSGINAEVIRA